LSYLSVCRRSYFLVLQVHFPCLRSPRTNHLTDNNPRQHAMPLGASEQRRAPEETCLPVHPCREAEPAPLENPVKNTVAVAHSQEDTPQTTTESAAASESQVLPDSAAQTAECKIVVPRRRSGCYHSPQPSPVSITTEILELLFDFPLPVAAHKLGLSVTTVKRICRKLGISKWPYKAPIRPRDPLNPEPRQPRQPHAHTLQEPEVDSLPNPWPSRLGTRVVDRWPNIASVSSSSSSAASCGSTSPSSGQFSFLHSLPQALPQLPVMQPMFPPQPQSGAAVQQQVNPPAIAAYLGVLQQQQQQQDMALRQEQERREHLKLQMDQLIQLQLHRVQQEHEQRETARNLALVDMIMKQAPR